MYVSPSRKGIEIKPQKYKFSLFYYDEKKGEYRHMTIKDGEKAAQYLKKKGIFEVLREAKPGDILQLSEKGIYKKAHEGWVNALNVEEAKKALPVVGKIISVLSKQVQMPSPEIFSEEAEKKYPAPFIQVEFLTSKQEALIHKFKEHPLFSQLGKDIEQIAKNLKEMEEHYKVTKDSTQIQAEKKKLDHLLELAKTIIYAEKEFGKPPVLTRIGSGKVKAFYIKKSEPLYAYGVPIEKSILGGKEAEMKKEVATAKEISKNLQRYYLSELLSREDVKGVQMATRLLESFGSLEEIITALNLRKEEFAKKVGFNEEEVNRLYKKKKEIQELVKKGENLALDLQEVEASEQLLGQYTVRTPRALHDLEEEIREGPPDLKTKINLALSFLKGLADLHRAGYVHGDLKLDNILVFVAFDAENRPFRYVKITDFGKSIIILAEEEALLAGNPRFAAPESKLSKKGEVYSAALVLIRIFEEGFLDEKSKMLYELKKEEIDISIAPEESRRGVERYAIMNKAMPQTEVKSLRGRFRVYGRASLIYGPSVLQSLALDKEAAENAIHRYIDALSEKLQVEMGPKKAEEFNFLLKEMTRSNPELRPDIAEVTRRFEAI